METFLLLVVKLIPLYFLIVLGYIAGRFLEVDKRSVATIAIYIVTPPVIFYGIAKANLGFGYALLPVVMFVLASSICLSFLFYGKRIGAKELSSVHAFMAGSGNTGYFGIPVAVMVFGEEVLGIVAICGLGGTLFENSLGVYTLAAGKYSGKEALRRVLTLPTLYGFLFGLAANLTEIELSPAVTDMLSKFVGAYTVLGMMIIGIGLSEIKRTSIDLSLISSSIFSRFVAWPLLTGGVLLLDATFFGVFSVEEQGVLTFLSIVPVAANSVAWAAVFNLHPDRVALAVLVNTLVAAVYIPVFLGIFSVVP